MNLDRVHTLADLDSWSFPGTALAVLGHPVAHSISPAMHNAALAHMARADEKYSTWRYFKFDIAPDDLAAALPRFHARGFLGLNLTIPHKVLAVELIEAVDPAAAESGAVNTLLRTPTGYRGFNTDGYGVTRAIAEELGCCVADRPVILLGAGGAARAAAVACLRAGCPALWIGNRTAANLERLLATLAPVARAAGRGVHGFDLGDPPAGLPADAIVINATSAGLKPGDPPPIDVARLPGTPLIYDMIYNPPETPLMCAARARGLTAANGLAMLVHQGVRALEIWSESAAPADVMHAACRAALGRSHG